MAPAAIAMLLSFQTPEPPIQWASSLPVAISHARKQGKLILAMSLTARGGSRLSAALHDPRVRPSMRRFVCVAVEGLPSLGNSLKGRPIGVATTMMLFESDGKQLARLVGFSTSKDVQEILDRSAWSSISRPALEERQKRLPTANETAKLALCEALAGNIQRADALLMRTSGADLSLLSRVHLALADQYRSDMRYQEALPRLHSSEQYARTTEEKFRAQYRKMISYMRLGKPEEALVMARRALALPGLGEEEREFATSFADRLAGTPAQDRKPSTP